jgi:hypothetical protein
MATASWVGYGRDADTVVYIAQDGRRFIVRSADAPEPTWEQVECFSEDAEPVRQLHPDDLAECEATRIAYGME